MLEPGQHFVRDGSAGAIVYALEPARLTLHHTHGITPNAAARAAAACAGDGMSGSPPWNKRPNSVIRCSGSTAGRWPEGQAVTVRPVLPQDAALQHDFFTRQMGNHSRYQRFMISMRELPSSTAEYFTRIDYHDHFALIAETFDDKGHRQVGDARFVREHGQPESAEFALAVADAWQGRSVGRRLLQTLVSAAQGQGVQTLFGDVLRDNTPMLGLAQASGFAVRRHPDDARLLRVSRALPLLQPRAGATTRRVRAGRWRWPGRHALAPAAYGLIAPSAANAAPAAAATDRGSARMPVRAATGAAPAPAFMTASTASLHHPTPPAATSTPAHTPAWNCSGAT